MSFENFRQIIREVQKIGKCRLCVAAAADEKVLAAVREARKEDFVDITLLGHEEWIWRLALKTGLNLRGIEIIDVADPVEATVRAVAEVGSGKADILMKGMVNSADFLHAILDPSGGLRGEGILSHLAALEIPGYYRLIYVSDGGLNVNPDLARKKVILHNAVRFLQAIGIAEPRVAVLSANERVSDKVPSTVEARELKKIAERGEIMGALVEGPISLDAAIDEEAALHKGIESPVAGHADLLLVPDIDTGNVLAKAVIYFARGRMAGLILGGKRPVILTSRNEPHYGKLASIALAAYSIVRGRPG
ncbi:MAG TPA: bifunctional enoyl-CoA hydratase/phosphate acetyltransferase [Atribacteraceae bacterium]|nr:bifunctional enoyl-CoA hydratase/phosphate acetyltransferase [Atribacteraceae bacterium]